MILLKQVGIDGFVYIFTIEDQTFAIDTLSVALDKVNQLVNEYYSDVTCELELVPEGDN